MPVHEGYEDAMPPLEEHWITIVELHVSCQQDKGMGRGNLYGNSHFLRVLDLRYRRGWTRDATGLSSTSNNKGLLPKPPLPAG